MGVLRFKSSIKNCLVVVVDMDPGREACFLFMGPHCLDTAIHLNTEPGQAARFVLRATCMVTCHNTSAF